jgi:DNA-binding MarR family transcriptional regulator
MVDQNKSDIRDQQLNTALEAMHFGFRAMIYRPDERLKSLGYSRIHHRLLYFIGRNPGCSVNQLLEILAVTKQYLNQPLRRLIDDGYVVSNADAEDGRKKRLALSDPGRELENELTGMQRERFRRIFELVGPDAEENWHQIMRLLSDPEI